MRKNTLLLAILVGFCLLLTPTMAKADFDVTYEITEDTIYPDEIALFTVTLTNLDAYEDTYTLFSIDPSWIIQTEPTTLKANPESSTTFQFQVQPKKDIETGPYLLPIRINSVNSKASEELVFFIYLKSYLKDPGKYRPTVDLSVRVPEEYDPREKAYVEVLLRNRNNLFIDTLDVRISSELFYKEYTTSLDGLEQKTNELLFDVDPLVSAGVYPVTVEIFMDNNSLSQVVKNIVVIDYSKVEEESYTVNELFKSTEYITVKNVGNEKKTGVVERQKNFFARIFTKTDPPKKSEMIEGKRIYQWSIKLDPQEEYQIVVVENYRFLASIIIIIILIIIGYYLFRSPIVTLKKAKLFGLKEEGASFIKLKIFMKNRTKKPVYNIKIIDKVPKMAKVVDDQDVLGTLKPTKVIRHQRAGTIVRWDIEKLDPYEERIITYKIRSHLKIVGSIKLASAKIKFDTGLGRERSVYSNSVNIDTEVISQRTDYREDIKRLKGRI